MSFFKRLSFNWKAQTAHGLHSPRVFAWYKDVINPCYAANPSDFNQAFIEAFGNYVKKELIIIDLALVKQAELQGLLTLLSDTSHVIICLHPHANLNTGYAWTFLCQQASVVQSIALFELGILSLDPIAPKQHFKLKAM